MKTTEFLSASQQVQQLFMNRWSEHQKFLQEAAQRQQEAMQGQMVQQAVAQATQQAAAQAASETVKSVMEQLRAQSLMAPMTENAMAQSQVS